MCREVRHRWAGGLLALRRLYRSPFGGMRAAAVIGALAMLLAPLEARAELPAMDAQQTGRADLVVQVVQSGARVVVDGQLAGLAPLSPLQLSIGRHTLAVAKDGFRTDVRVVDIQAGTTTVEIALEQSSERCRVAVGVDSAEPLALLVDGREVGVTPWSDEVAPGAHVLTTLGEAAETEPTRVDCEDGRALTLTLHATPRPATLEVDVDPQALVYVDLRLRGSGHVRLEEIAGHHHVEVLRPGFRSWRTDVLLTPGSTTKLSPSELIADDAVGKAKHANDPKQYRGLYGRLGLAFLRATQATGALGRNCPATPSGGVCRFSGPFASQAVIRLGYAFGWVAAEVFGGAVGQLSVVEANYRDASRRGEADFYGLARKETHTFGRYGFVVGAGARLTTPTQGARGTLGVGLALSRETTRYARASAAVTVIPELNGQPQRRLPDAELDNRVLGSSSSPSVVCDVGLLVGSTPGAKLELSLVLVVQWPNGPLVPASQRRLGYDTLFDRDARTYPKATAGSPAFATTSDVEIFIGPRLGFQFGH